MAMNKKEFIELLAKRLRENNISDVEEIISEYEAHFHFKLSDGYSEEEIAGVLGDPEEIAAQYTPDRSDQKNSGKKAVIIAGLALADIFAGAFFLLFFAWILVMGAFTIASFAAGIYYLGGFDRFAFIPSVPYFWCRILYAFMLLALAVLSGVGTIYCAFYCRQLMRVYGRFCKNLIASAANKATLPLLGIQPQFSAKTRRILRKLALMMLAVFAVTFILAYISSAAVAGALEFWHAWNWFS